MKIRIGFVSNSSTTSFVFGREPRWPWRVFQTLIRWAGFYRMKSWAKGIRKTKCRDCGGEVDYHKSAKSIPTMCDGCASLWWD